MNFWEARQAALNGKKVKRADDTESLYIYNKVAMLSCGFEPEDIAADWVIIKEPEYKTYYVNIYSKSLGVPKDNERLAVEAMNSYQGSPYLARLAITVDDEGQFISAKNI
jgi:hypothetical protein